MPGRLIRRSDGTAYTQSVFNRASSQSAKGTTGAIMDAIANAANKNDVKIFFI